MKEDGEGCALQQIFFTSTGAIATRHGQQRRAIYANGEGGCGRQSGKRGESKDRKTFLLSYGSNRGFYLVTRQTLILLSFRSIDVVSVVVGAAL
jgi:hypothetical protein